MTDASSSPDPEPLRSVHTSTFPQILADLGCSLLITTYQAGKLIAARSDGAVLNTHFRTFAKPMGLTADRRGFVLGCAHEVVRYANMSAVARKLTPPDKHDACFLPRSSHVTGDIDIHEMEHDGRGVLWCVNTRFSCLCTLDPESRVSLVNPSGGSCGRTDSLLGDDLFWPRFAPLRAALRHDVRPKGAVGLRTALRRMA